MNTARINMNMPLQVKALNSAQGTFTGLGAAFGNEDYNGDIIERGAFAKTLQAAQQVKDRTHSAVLYPLLWMHKEDQPCGSILSARETADGLVIDCQCDLNTELGRMAYSGIREGYANGLSIGYYTVTSTRDQKGIRHLHELRLAEVSVITAGYAANPLALVDSASVKFVNGKGTSMSMNSGTSFNPHIGWTNQRVAAPHVEIPACPQPDDFKSDDKYRVAWAEWQHKYNGRLTDSTRQIEREGYNDEEVGFTQLNQSMDDINAGLIAQRAARVANGTASHAERMAEYNRTGKTADGRTLPDTSADIAKAYAALDADPEIQRARAQRDNAPSR